MQRRYVIFVAALIAFLGSTSATWATIVERNYQLRGYVDATQSANLPYRVPRLGVNVDLTQYNTGELIRHFELMTDAKITWVRQFVYWDAIEAAPGVLDWSEIDRILNVLMRFPNLRPVIVLMNTPQWARSSGTSTAPPDDPSDFARFGAAFASRYAEQVDYYQIWDEPNLNDAWGLHDPRPAEYAALLSEAYRAIHSADAQATVIAAALAPTIEKRGQNIADLLYLEDLYALGASAYFDAVAAKPYGFNASPDDRTVRVDTLNFSRIVALREVMVQNGDSRKAVWASNWGWNALPLDWSGELSIWGQVTQQQQIAYSHEALDRAEREWPWLAGMILQHWQPNLPVDNAQWGFSLLTPDGETTPLWDALAQRDVIDAASNGLYHPKNPHARYSGLWTFGPLGADIGWLETSDSRLEFEFMGRELALWLREGDYMAFLYPTVDQEQANATPRDSGGRSYIFLRSATLEPELNLVPAARNLKDEPHTLQLVADKGWDQWALAGLAVSSGNLARPYNIQIRIAQFTMVIAGLAALVSGYQFAWYFIFSQLRHILERISIANQVAVSAMTSLALLAGLLLTWNNATPEIFRRDISQWGILLFITVGLIGFQPGFLLVIVAMLILFIFIYNRLEIGLILTLFWAPFFLFPVELYTFAFPLVEVLFLLTTAAWILRGIVTWGALRQSANRQLPLSFSLNFQPMDVLMIAWGVLGILTLFWSQQQSVAVTELRTIIFEPLLFYFILRTLKANNSLLIQLANTLILAGAAVSIIGLVLYLQGEAIITAESGARRLASVYGSPNNVGLFLGRCIPFALAYAVITKNRWRRIASVAATALMLLTVALTQSVGAVLFGVPAGISVVLIAARGKRGLALAGGLLVIGSAGTAMLTRISTRFASLLDFSTGTSFIRLRVWESTFEILKEKPLTGLGLDQFLYAFRGHYIRPDAIIDPDLSHPHNIVLDFWVRLGMPGVVLLFMLQYVFWKQLWAALRRHRDDMNARVLIVGAMGSMAALIAHGLIDNSVFVIDLAFVFAFLMGVSANLANSSAIDANLKQ